MFATGKGKLPGNVNEYLNADHVIRMMDTFMSGGGGGFPAFSRIFSIFPAFGALTVRWGAYALPCNSSAGETLSRDAGVLPVAARRCPAEVRRLDRVQMG